LRNNLLEGCYSWW